MEQNLQQLEEKTNPTNGQQTIIIQNGDSKQNQSNGIGTAGFVLALIGLFLGWVPILGLIIWVLGLILSGVGVTREPKGLAIAGLVISLIQLIILIFVIGAIGAALAAS